MANIKKSSKRIQNKKEKLDMLDNHWNPMIADPSPRVASNVVHMFCPTPVPDKLLPTFRHSPLPYLK